MYLLPELAKNQLYKLLTIAVHAHIQRESIAPYAILALTALLHLFYSQPTLRLNYLFPPSKWYPKRTKGKAINDTQDLYIEEEKNENAKFVSFVRLSNSD